MTRQHLFDRTSRQAVTRYIDNIVGARHNKHIATAADITGVARFIITGEMAKVRFFLPLTGIPQHDKGARRQRLFNHQRTDLTNRQTIAMIIQYLHIEARHRTT